MYMLLKPYVSHSYALLCQHHTKHEGPPCAGERPGAGEKRSSNIEWMRCAIGTVLRNTEILPIDCSITAGVMTGVKHDSARWPFELIVLQQIGRNHRESSL